MGRKTIVILLLLALLLSSCSHQPHFRQPAEDIVQIALIDYSASEDGILCTLVDAEIALFMNDLQELECRKRLQPIGDFSDLEIRIYYLNGDVDILGSMADGYIEQGKLHINGWYYYNEEALRELFSKYMG